MDVSTVVPERSQQRPDQASEPWQRQHDDGVGSGEANVEGTAVVPIDDPGVGGKKVVLHSSPFFGRRCYPAWLPEMLIEVDDRDTGSSSVKGEGRLPRPA